MSEYTVSRDSQRVPLETRVQLKFEWFGGFISEYSSNISPGGMFIRTQTPEPAGRMIGFELRLGDGYELIRGTGEVIWARMLDQGPDKPAGMGIRFLEISPAGRELIYQMVDNFIAQGGVPFDVTSPPGGPEADAADVADVANAANPANAAARAPASAPVAAPAPEPVAPRAELPWPPAVLTPAAPVPPALEREPEPAWPAPLAPTFGVGVAEEAAPRRGSRLVLWVGLGGLLLLATALAILKQDVLLGFFVPAKTPAAPAVASGPPRRPRPAAAPQASPSPAPEAPMAPEAPIPPIAASSKPPAATPAPAPAAASSPPAATPPPPPQPVTALEPPVNPPTAPTAPGGGSLGEIRKITWKQQPGETEVVLWADGPLERQDFSHYRIDGESPRELVKLYGIRHPFATARLPAGTQQLLQVRTGYHAGPKGNELHVVLDLTGPGVEVTGIEAQGAELHIHLKGK
jgi:uncharacterized protein (TIGR02266 family)